MATSHGGCDRSDEKMPDVLIRDMREADLASVADVWFRAWHAAFPDLSHPMPYEAWLPRLRGEIAATCVCRVATCQDALIGFVAVDVAKACLEQIFVAPEHQGGGIGKRLVDDVKRLSPLGPTLTTLQRNVRAVTFYREQGLAAGRSGINPVNGLPNVEFVWRPAIAGHARLPPSGPRGSCGNSG